MSTGHEAQLFDLGYRAYDGPRKRPVAAMFTLGVFTAKRILGIGRGGRHKVLPAITLAIAFVPALISLAIAGLTDAVAENDLISFGDYGFFTGSALVLFAALLAPEALCTDRRSGLLGLYLAGPLDRTRYLAAKWAAVFAVMLLITVGPLLFVLVSFLVGGYGPSIGEAPKQLLQIVASGIVIALLYTALSMAVSSFTTRRAAAAIATVLVLIVPASIVRPAIDSGGAPKELDLLSFPLVAGDLSYRIFGEPSDDAEPVAELSTGIVTLGFAAAVLGFLGICWLRYRRLEAVK
jgi:ABC-2 type transport system permease protein